MRVNVLAVPVTSFLSTKHNCLAIKQEIEWTGDRVDRRAENKICEWIVEINLNGGIKS